MASLLIIVPGMDRSIFGVSYHLYTGYFLVAVNKQRTEDHNDVSAIT